MGSPCVYGVAGDYNAAPSWKDNALERRFQSRTAQDFRFSCSAYTGGCWSNSGLTMRFPILFAVAAAALVLSPLSHAQTWPTKPIRMIVPFPPGGSVDSAGRIVGSGLSSAFGQPVVVENLAGAGGNIGVAAIAKASPDAYTIGLGATGTIAINVSTMENLPFDPIKDLSPITLIAITPVVLVAHPSAKADSVRELVALAKATPGGLSFASSGRGGALHLSGELFKIMTGAPLVHVPYKGAAPAVQDLLGGQVPIGFVDLTSTLAQIRAGKLKAIGTTGARRSLTAPDLPTVAEQGIPGYAADGWVGLFAPAGVPPAVVARLNRETVAILSDPKTREKMLAAALEPAPMTPAAFAQFIQTEIATWGRAAKAAGVSLK